MPVSPSAFTDAELTRIKLTSRSFETKVLDVLRWCFAQFLLKQTSEVARTHGRTSCETVDREVTPDAIRKPGEQVTKRAVKLKIMFDERSADVRVITDAVAMDDGIYQRKRAQEKDQQNSRVATRTIWESAAIKADGLKIFLGVNPTFFAVNTDLDPDIRTNAQIDSAL
jgi:hypothetical protein